MDLDKDAFLQMLMDEQALRFGSFTLKSGAFSPFFINLGDVASGNGLWMTGRYLAQLIQTNFPDATLLFGPPYKGIALITATAMAIQSQFQKNIRILYNRKEQKAHGEKGAFVGKKPGEKERVLVVDDVMSTGGTKLEAIRKIENAFNVSVAGVVVTVDRRLRDDTAGIGGYAIRSLVDMPYIIDFLQRYNNPHADKLQNFYEGKYET